MNWWDMTAALCFFAGAAALLIGVRAGTYQSSRPRTDRMQSLIPGLALTVCGLVVLLLTGS